jgi:hypothetical protein
MHASNKKSDEAQGLDSSAFEQAAIVFTFTGFAAAAIGPDLHQFLAALSPLTPALKIAAGIFPMASEASRMGRFERSPKKPRAPVRMKASGWSARRMLGGEPPNDFMRLARPVPGRRRGVSFAGP